MANRYCSFHAQSGKVHWQLTVSTHLFFLHLSILYQLNIIASMSSGNVVYDMNMCTILKCVPRILKVMFHIRFPISEVWENTMYKRSQEYPQKDCDLSMWKKSLLLLSEFVWHGVSRSDVVFYSSPLFFKFQTFKQIKTFVKTFKTKFMQAVFQLCIISITQPA